MTPPDRTAARAVYAISAPVIFARVRVAPDKVVSVRSRPLRSAPVKAAPSRSAQGPTTYPAMNFHFGGGAVGASAALMPPDRTLPKMVPLRSTPDRFAPVSTVSRKLALVTVAPARSAPVRSAIYRLDPTRSVPAMSAPVRLARIIDRPARFRSL